MKRKSKFVSILCILVAVLVLASAVLVALSPIWMKEERISASAQPAYPENSGNTYLDNWYGDYVMVLSDAQFIVNGVSNYGSPNSFFSFKIGINPVNGVLYMNISAFQFMTGIQSYQIMRFEGNRLYETGSSTDPFYFDQYLGTNTIPDYISSMQFSKLQSLPSGDDLNNKIYKVEYYFSMVRDGNTSSGDPKYTWNLQQVLYDATNEDEIQIASFFVVFDFGGVSVPSSTSSARQSTTVQLYNPENGTFFEYNNNNAMAINNELYATVSIYVDQSFVPGAGDFYQDGYNSGYNVGYNSGYSSGYTEGAAVSYSGLSAVSLFLSPVSSFLSTPLFGTFSIGSAFSVVLVVLLGAIFIKMFAGG